MNKIYTITQPDSFLRRRIHPDNRNDDVEAYEAESNSNWAITSSLNHLMIPYYEANISFNLFAKSQLEFKDCSLGRKKDEFGEPIPRAFCSRIVYMNARMFVYSLDTYRRQLKNVRKVYPSKQVVDAAITKFDKSFKELKGVRDSAHHREDRVLGKRGKKDIVVSSFPQDAFKSPSELVNVSGFSATINERGGVILTDSINGNVYGLTDEKGEYSAVSVSEDSMLVLQEITQSLYDGLEWSDGMEVQLPN